MVRSPRAPPTTISASSASRTGRLSPAGDAVAMFPPSVPRFWIWAAPTSAAISARTGACSDDERAVAQLGVRRARPHDQGAIRHADPTQLRERREVEVAGRPGDPGRPFHQRVRAAGERPPATFGEERVRVREGPRRLGVGIVEVQQSPDRARRSHRGAALRTRRGARVRSGDRRSAALRRQPDRLDDPSVARAATEVPGDRLADRGVRGGVRGGVIGGRGAGRRPRVAPAAPNPGTPAPPSASPACRSRTGPRRSRRRQPGAGRAGRPSASPSTVRTSRPSTWQTGTRQLSTTSPSRRTEQAPHSPSPQPSFDPVRPRSRRRTSSRRRPPGTATSTDRPLTVKRNGAATRPAADAGAVTGPPPRRARGPARGGAPPRGRGSRRGPGPGSPAAR